MTIEDPVEYQMGGINQVPVKPDIGLTFATGLRAFLRQDPDIILVGEVRDQETAEICIRASLTGHLVFSTLHTNDAPTAINRLVDIGIKPYLLAGSLVLLVAQRLVRMLCESCKEPVPVNDYMRKEYGFKVDRIYQAKGCKECRNIGFWGRVAIYELLPIDEEFRRMIASNASADDIRKIQRKKGYATLLTSGLKKVEEGVTSLEEILSIAVEESKASFSYFGFGNRSQVYELEKGDSESNEQSAFGKTKKKKSNFLTPLFYHVSTRDLISFAVQLSALLKAGIPLIRSIEIIQKGSNNLYLKDILKACIKNLSMGLSLSYALSEYPKVFPPIWQNLIEVGEMGGNLPQALSEIAGYQESAAKLKSRVISAFFYPIVLSVLATAALSFLL